MCSRLLQKMENYQGDLADILRASGGRSIASSNISSAEASVSVPRDWQFPSNQAGMYEEPSLDEFGDPFTNMRDPLLLPDMDHMPTSGFYDASSTDHIITSGTTTAAENTGGFSCSDVGGGGGVGGCNNSSSLLTQRILDDHELSRRPPNNIFTRMLQISPNAKLPSSPRESQLLVAASPRGLKPPTLVTNDMINTSNNSKVSVIENAPVQISSPRNTGIKRRKSQAKKVVCIPAPAPANSRPSGEIVPSDLWAWRKYGQKPIKGSPYPRGYYRCSSSKGCSARKQVERSRTDPNMLVITYTSEHNHPWPTQRNALAGSTRSQPTKSGSTSKATNSSHSQKATNLKEEEKPETQTDNASSPIVTGSSSTGQIVKEEREMEMEVEGLDKKMEMDNLDQFNEGFPQSYKPGLPDSNHSEDFFADLSELEADPLNLLFTQGYSGDEERENKNLELFSFYDWTTNNSSMTTTTTTIMTTTTITSSLEEAEKGS